MIIIESRKNDREKSREVEQLSEQFISQERGVRCKLRYWTYFVVIMRKFHFFEAFVFFLPILLRNMLFYVLYRGLTKW